MLNRRSFLGKAAAGSAAAMAVTARASAASASERVVVAVMGLSRGRSLAQGFQRLDNVEVKYVCDIDTERVARCVGDVKKIGGKPQGIGDYRRILDDKEIDALVCAAPNHWHAPATIYACNAGKNVYVEKPCSQNPYEGELMIKAARKNNKAVQVGTQRRSGPQTIEAMQKLHEGAIGKVYQSRAYYNSVRPTIGKGKPADVPDNIDFELWQGPVPRVPYIDNLVHYNWHWRWNWGNGELGNNGVHTLDLCRWGVNVDFPIRVTSSGGRYCFDDDQETPDTHNVAFEFEGGRQITWQGLSCNRHTPTFVKTEGNYRAGGRFIEFYGDQGSLELESNGSYRIFDKSNKLVEEVKGATRGDTEHLQNFVDAIRNDTPRKLNVEIEIGHKSTLMCHLGNIAQRTGRTLNCSSKDGHIIGDEQAMKLWRREYEPGWEPTV
ncbi:MAG: dehydrogenase [Planctomycetaceae bacterium]|nr:dehydrogenase [Planctomycetaceae bacterium]